MVSALWRAARISGVMGASKRGWRLAAGGGPRAPSGARYLGDEWPAANVGVAGGNGRALGSRCWYKVGFDFLFYLVKLEAPL